MTDVAKHEDILKLTAREFLTRAEVIRSSSIKARSSEQIALSVDENEEKLLLSAASLSLGSASTDPNLVLNDCMMGNLKHLEHGDYFVSHSAAVSGDISYTRNSRFISTVPVSSVPSSPGKQFAARPSYSLEIAGGENINRGESLIKPLIIDPEIAAAAEEVDLGASFVAHARLAMLYYKRSVEAKNVPQKVPESNSTGSSDLDGTDNSGSKQNNDAEGDNSKNKKNSININIMSNKTDLQKTDLQHAEAAAAVAMKIYRIVFCYENSDEIEAAVDSTYRSVC